MITDNIVSEVKDAGWFSIMVDESKDPSKKEQLSFCLRYTRVVSCGPSIPRLIEIQEEFIKFARAELLDADSVFNKIDEFVLESGLSYQNLVGQTYYDASVMSGTVSGVQSRIQNVCPKAAYPHCFAHRLNLIIVHLTREVADCQRFLR